MKRLILLILLFFSLAANAQQNFFPTLPTGYTTPLTPQFRTRAETPDSTNDFFYVNPLTGKAYRIYTGVQAQNLLKSKADSVRLYGTELPSVSPIIGNVFDSPLTSSAGFTQQTTVTNFTFGSTGLAISGSPGNSYRDLVYWNASTLLFTDWQTSANITVTSLGNGIGIGYYGTQYHQGPILFVNSNGTISLKIDSATTLATSTNKLTISNGDKLRVFFTKQHRALFAFVYDLTSGTVATVQYSINNNYNTSQLQSLGYPALTNSGGSYLVTNWKFGSDKKRNPLYALIGDSITEWAFSYDSDMDMAAKIVSKEILNGRSYEEYAIGGVTVTQAISSLPFILSTHPQYVIALIGDNDALQGASSPTIYSNIKVFADSVRKGGAIPIFITPTPFQQGGPGLVAIKGVRDSLMANRNLNMAIDIWTPLAQPGQNYIDTLYNSGAGHPNRAGQIVMATEELKILDSLQLFTGGSRIINGTITANGVGATGGSNSSVNTIGIAPGYGFSVTGQGTDGKNWDLNAYQNTLSLRLTKDCNCNPTTNILTVTRSGMTVTNIDLFGPLTVSSTAEVQGMFYHRNGLNVLNKAGTGWLSWFSRNTTGSEVTVDLNDISSINSTTTSTPLNIGSVVNHAQQVRFPNNIDAYFGTVGVAGIGQYFNPSTNYLTFYNGVGGADIFKLSQNGGPAVLNQPLVLTVPAYSTGGIMPLGVNIATGRIESTNNFFITNTANNVTADQTMATGHGWYFQNSGATFYAKLLAGTLTSNQTITLDDNSAGSIPGQTSGTWTPVCSDGGTASYATWKKTGTEVTIRCVIASGTSASTSVYTISGLPFTSSSENYSSSSVGFQNISSAFTPTAVIAPSTTSFSIYNGQTALTNVQMASTAFLIQITYSTVN